MTSESHTASGAVGIAVLDVLEEDRSPFSADDADVLASTLDRVLRAVIAATR